MSYVSQKVINNLEHGSSSKGNLYYDDDAVIKHTKYSNELITGLLLVV